MMHIVNVSERQTDLTILDTNDHVAFGATVEVPEELGDRLVDGPDWARTNSNAARDARKAAKRRAELQAAQSPDKGAESVEVEIPEPADVQSSEQDSEVDA